MESARGAGQAAVPLGALKVGAGTCFALYGAVGIIPRDAWLPASLGAVGELAPAIVGAASEIVPASLPAAAGIALGAFALLRPLPALLLAMAFWGLQAAMPGAAAAEPGWARLAGAAGAGLTLALLSLTGWPRSIRQWFSPVRAVAPDERAVRQTAAILRVTTAVLLIAHGGAGALAPGPAWASYFTGNVEPNLAARFASGSPSGWFEIGIGLTILAWPWRGVLPLACAGMLGAETVRAVAGAPLGEHVAGGVSCVALFGLFWLQASLAGVSERSQARARHRERLRALLGIGRGEDHLDLREVLDGRPSPERQNGPSPLACRRANRLDDRR
jgi:hypothetical protein